MKLMLSLKEAAERIGGETQEGLLIKAMKKELHLLVMVPADCRVVAINKRNLDSFYRDNNEYSDGDSLLSMERKFMMPVYMGMSNIFFAFDARYLSLPHDCCKNLLDVGVAEVYDFNTVLCDKDGTLTAWFWHQGLKKLRFIR